MLNRHIHALTAHRSFVAVARKRASSDPAPIPSFCFWHLHPAIELPFDARLLIFHTNHVYNHTTSHSLNAQALAIMYLRAIHAELDIPSLRKFIRENPLGILITALP